MKVIKSTRNSPMLGYDVTLFIGDIDLHQILQGGNRRMNYYDLRKEKRWLDNDSPYSVGGRDTDISVIACFLAYRVRELFSINEVPPELVAQLHSLEAICGECEKMIEETISLISDFVK